MEDFDKPKIVYMEIQTDNPMEGFPFPCYSYDMEKCIVLNTAYIMSSNTVDTRYILGILNSKLGKFLIKSYVTQLQKRQFRMLAQYVMKFPIAIANKYQECEMINLVQNVLVNKSMSAQERINNLAYEIYNLTKEEEQFFSKYE